MTSSVVVLSLIGAAILLAAVVRGCEGTSSVEFCAEIESLSSFVCHCNTDYCNSASHVTVSMVTALLLALVAMVFRF
ncbi:hypothetical protein MAR_004905 [Mya arenaria]|uniref:Uncharacterized protein n=1 Tax=Mya arenaria TaxID=6604 RepID=A0ABY7EZK3_MYAAR|nr:hypothetical protein MAR_004905 [Mya arenaria]